MKTKFVTLSIVSLLLLPLAAYTQPVTSSEESGSAPPPISQPLVREGDFAMKLVSALNLGTADSGTEAENILTSAGIAPKNGWISDYPVTPVVIGQLQQSIEATANAGALPMESSQAINTFQTLVIGEGLPIQVASGTSPPEGTANYGEYSDTSIINNYYYDEGPPVVTYYPPPPAYVYLYAWVPFPFWWAGFWFPGYYCLNDFDVVLFVHHRREVCTNHFFSPVTRRFVRINPRTLAFERGFHGRRDLAPRQWSEHAGRIYRHDFGRFRTGNSAHLRGPAERFRTEKMQRPQASNHFTGRQGEGRFQSLPNRSMTAPQGRAFRGSERSFGNFHSPSMAGRSEGFRGGFGHSVTAPGARGFEGSRSSFGSHQAPSMGGQSEEFHGGGFAHGFQGGFKGRSFGEFHGGGFHGSFGHRRG